MLRRAGGGALLALVGLLLLYTAYRRWTYLIPPTDEGPSLAQVVRIEPTEEGTRLIVGDSWIERRRGLWQLHLNGTAREIGHAHGLLAGRLYSRLDRQLVAIAEREAPGALSGWWHGNRLRWHFRHLLDELPPRQLVELGALSRTLADTRDLGEAPFQRLAYYQALFDQLQHDGDRTPARGLAFAAWGRQSVGGHLVVGRSFDLTLGTPFEQERALLVVRSSDRIPFVAVGWPGLTGVLTGVNARQIFVAVNGVHTDDDVQKGAPVLSVAREILERATTIKEAVALLEGSPVMGAAALLIADGKGPEAVVVELAPRAQATRRGKRGLIVVTNHLLHKRFSGDARNDRLRRYTASDLRYRRANQLLRRSVGRIDGAMAASILRDRSGLDEQPLALGHMAAIDAMIATHGVVADLSAQVLWVARGPALVGSLVAVDLKPLFGVPITAGEAPKTVPADALLSSAVFERHRLVREQIEHARRLAAVRAWRQAIDFAGRAVAGAPDLPQAQKLLGDLLWASGDPDGAKRCYRRYIRLAPTAKMDVEPVRARLLAP